MKIIQLRTESPLYSLDSNKPRSSRPKSYTPREERIILRFIRNNPKSVYKDIRRECAVKISTTTIKSILHNYGISNWRSKKRPFLTEAVARKGYL
jgi:transposase